MWHPEHPESKVDLDKEEKRAFPYGKIGEVRYDILIGAIVIIESCEMQPHEEGAAHDHVYLPNSIGMRRDNRYTTTWITNPGSRLVKIEDHIKQLRKEYNERNDRQVQSSEERKSSAHSHSDS